jgi:hypothetical protein
MSQMFDIDRAIRESGLPKELVDDLVREVREEFPDEELMFELHVIRALQSEQASRMSSEQWRDNLQTRTASMLEAHGLESIISPGEEIPRIQHRNQPRTSAG